MWYNESTGLHWQPDCTHSTHVSMSTGRGRATTLDRRPQSQVVSLAANSQALGMALAAHTHTVHTCTV